MAPAPRRSPPRTLQSQSIMIACHAELKSDHTGSPAGIAAGTMTIMLRQTNRIGRNDTEVWRLERSDLAMIAFHNLLLRTRKRQSHALFWCPRLFHSSDEIVLAHLHQRELHLVAGFDFVHQRFVLNLKAMVIAGH